MDDEAARAQDRVSLRYAHIAVEDRHALVFHHFKLVAFDLDYATVAAETPDHVTPAHDGLVLTLPVWLRRGATGFWNRTDGHPPHPDAHYAFARSSVPKVPKR